MSSGSSSTPPPAPEGDESESIAVLSEASHSEEGDTLATEGTVAAEAQVASEGKSKGGIINKLVISLLLGGLFAWLVNEGGVPIIPSEEDFEHVRWWVVPAYVGTLAVTHFLRASRWRFLIAPVRKMPLREVIALNWIGFFAIFALPLRIGEVARPALTKARHGISVSVGLGTIAVERVIDGLVTSLCVAWALFALPRLPEAGESAQMVTYYGSVFLAVFSGAMVALAVFLWQRDWAVRTTKVVLGIISKKLATLLADKVDGIADGIRSLASLRLTIGFLFETLLYWGTNAAGMWLLAWGCGLPISFGHAVALMGILAIGILLPAGPGLFGPFQYAIVKGLSLYVAADIVSSQGAAYIFLLYVVQTIFIILTGVVPLYTMKLRIRDLLGADAIRDGLKTAEAAE